MFRRLLVALFCMSVVAFGARAQDGRQDAIADVIGQQIEAFQADDFATAFTFASPMIKGIFGTPENFGMMVQQGYPMVYRPADVEMLELREVAGALWQRVMIRDTTGRIHMLDYQMVETPDGWQINAVQLLQPPDIGA